MSKAFYKNINPTNSMSVFPRFCCFIAFFGVFLSKNTTKDFLQKIHVHILHFTQKKRQKSNTAFLGVSWREEVGTTTPQKTANRTFGPVIFSVFAPLTHHGGVRKMENGGWRGPLHFA
jgi:hypothetical protein